MASDDVEIRERPPRKRRQLEQALEVELAVWLARDDLTPSERKKVEAEKERRKQDAPTIVGIVWGREGRTPAQFAAAREFPQTDPDVYETLAHAADFHEFVKAVNRVVALPKEMSRVYDPPAESVWAYVEYARHRGVPVKVILPDGSEYREE